MKEVHKYETRASNDKNYFLPGFSRIVFQKQQYKLQNCRMTISSKKLYYGEKKALCGNSPQSSAYFPLLQVSFYPPLVNSWSCVFQNTKQCLLKIQ